MIFKHRRLLTLSVFTVLSVFLAWIFSASFLLVFVCAAGVLSLLFLLLSRRHRRFRDVSVALFCLFLGLLSTLGTVEQREAFSSWEGEHTLSVMLDTVTYADETRTAGEGTLCVGELTGRVKITAVGTWKAGDILYGRATVTPTERESYLFSQGFYAEIHLASCRKTGEFDSVRVTLGKWRAALTERIQSALPEDEGNLLCALLLGVREGLSPTFSRDMARIGTIHMLSLSGMHFMILSGALTAVLERTRLSRKTRALLLALFALFFMLFTGLCSSVMRACFMFLFSLLPSLFREEKDSLSSLAAAVAVICLLEPYAVRDISLWLSAMSSFGILLFFERQRRHRDREERKPRRILAYLLFSFSVTISATVGVLPLTLFFFGQLPLLSPIANLLLAPLMQAALYLSLFVAFFKKTNAVVSISSFICKPIFAITEFLAHIKGTVLPLQNGMIPVLLMLFFTLVLGYYLFCPRERFRLRVPLSLLLSTAILIGGSAGFNRLRERNALEAEILSTTMGDALLFQTEGESLYIPITSAAVPAGEQVLFDAVGGELDGVLLPFYGNQSIAYLDALFSLCLVYRLYLPVPATADERQQYTRILALAATHGIPTTAYREKDTLSLATATLSRFSAVSSPVGTQIFFEVQYKGQRLQYYSGGRLSSDMLSHLRNADVLFFGGYGGPPPVKYDRSLLANGETTIHAPTADALPFFNAAGIPFRPSARFSITAKALND